MIELTGEEVVDLHNKVCSRKIKYTEDSTWNIQEIMTMTTNRFLIFLTLKKKEIGAFCRCSENWGLVVPIIGILFLVGITVGASSSIMWLSILCGTLIFMTAGIICFVIFCVILTLLYFVGGWLWENWKKAGEISKDSKERKEQS